MEHTFTTKIICLMYKNKPTEKYYDDSYMFVDLDSYSGGYPVRTTMLKAYDFKTVEKAKAYDVYNKFDVVELELLGTVTPINHVSL